jgi:putative N-acetylmannosamine-6-phosphate epimerase
MYIIANIGTSQDPPALGIIREDEDDNYVFVTPTTFEIRSAVIRRHDRAPLWAYAMLEIQLKES